MIINSTLSYEIKFMLFNGLERLMTDYTNNIQGLSLYSIRNDVHCNNLMI